jgi:hypothetical protein
MRLGKVQTLDYQRKDQEVCGTELMRTPSGWCVCQSSALTQATIFVVESQFYNLQQVPNNEVLLFCTFFNTQNSFM